MTRKEQLDELDRLIRRDPARRGLIATEEARGPLCPGHLAQAATDLANRGQRVVIVTGFFIPSASPPAPETDGPPGAAILAAALTSVGMTVQIATDEHCHRAVETAVREMNLPTSIVSLPGNTPIAVDQWFDKTMNTPDLPAWTHLIAIERAGPSHTQTSIRRQFELLPSGSLTQDQQELIEFEHTVPETSQDHCYNMRGLSLDDFTAPLHRLFENAQGFKNLKTIGVGDGGNEIGMGGIRWHELSARLNNPAVAKIPCRIHTDWTIVAGVSNWGAMALATATLLLLDKQSHLQPWTVRQQQEALQRIVTDGPAVDGITRLFEPTVDGLPFLTYIQPWEGMRRLVELQP